MPKAIYKGLCPVCGGPVSSDNLSRGLPCDACLSNVKSLNISDEYVDDLERLNRCFKELLGAEMWSAQRIWARRVFRGQSFSMIAPTGSGKTVFGIITAIYMAKRGRWKTLIIVPTSILAEQVYSKAKDFARKLKAEVEVVSYHTLMTSKEKEESLSRLKEGRGDIVILTSSFMTRRLELIRRYDFNLVFVDDVDGVLKSSKLFYFILEVLGFRRDLVDKVIEALKTKRWDELGSLTPPKDKVLVVSGASLRGRRTLRVKALRELLGFEIGSAPESMRNVMDTFLISKDQESELIALIKKLGHGGIVFIPQDKGLEYVRKIYLLLVNNGIQAEAYIRPKRGMLERFSKGEVNVLVGIASSRSPLSRGIDLPETVKYAIFMGVPKLRFILDPENLSPAKKLILLSAIREHLNRRDKNMCIRLMAKLRNALPLATAIHRGLEPKKEAKKYVSELLEHIDKFILKKLSDKEILEKLERSPYVELDRDKKVIKLIISDPIAYIQASGRTSRLYAGGISKGLSIILVDSVKAFNHLRRELVKRYVEIKFRDLREVDIDKVAKELEEERKLIKDIIRGTAKPELLSKVKVSLFVVESPNKARTIAWFFGRPSARRMGDLKVYEVHTGDNLLLITSTGGHVFDLVTDEGTYGIRVHGKEIIPIYSSVKKCLRCGETFTDDLDGCPKCGNKRIKDSIAAITSLRKLASEVDRVLIATDPDSEGEKIAWDVYLTLRPYNRDILRAEFHEVTPRAVLEAIKSPRPLNERMVESQILRRVEDRWVGFGLSGVVQRKFNIKTLSAGRVQTPVLGWVIRRYDDHKNNKIYLAILRLENGLRIVRELDVKNGHQARNIVKELEKSEVKLEIINREPREIQPWPPYTTDSMLRDAANLLGLSAGEAMILAQDLFEAGLITYHRTDSTRVSPLGISIAKSYIEEHFGKDYYKGRSWSQGREGAHECIRPTRPLDSDELTDLVASGYLRLPIKLSRRHISLYNLIFRRFIASQMEPCIVEKSKVHFSVGDLEGEIEVNTRILKEGFTKLIPLRTIEISRDKSRVIEASYRRVSRERLFTQGDIIALMKERGLGRPSTYAKIVETLMNRRYILSVSRRRVLIPLKMGREVFTYLAVNYSPLVSEERTRELLRTMDMVSQGKVDYREALMNIYRELNDLKLLRS